MKYVLMCAMLFTFTLKACGSTPGAQPKHAVDLSWQDTNTAGTVKGYNIYRSTTQGAACTGNVTAINTTPVPGKAYTDNTVTAGATYYYAVSALAATGTGESACSGETKAVIPANIALPLPPASLLAVPTTLSAMPAAKK